MARKIFKRVGIRRDKNLGDLSNSTEALNNLLDTLVDNPGSTFVSEDLNAIRGSFSIGFTNDQYNQIVRSEEVITSQSGVSSPFLPRITYQNKLDYFKNFAGEPRLFGGNGLTARYYNPEDVNLNSVGIFSGSPFKTDNFWEQGNFNYSGANSNKVPLIWSVSVNKILPARGDLKNLDPNVLCAFADFEISDIKTHK